MNLPQSSMVLLVPVGEEWSTVDTWQKDDMLTRFYGAKAGKELICRWLYNAKTVEAVHRRSDDIVDTRLLHAGRNLQMGQEIVWPGEHPLPWMEFSGTSVRAVGLSMDYVNDRWLDEDGNPGDTFFLAMVWLGEWYWSPAVLFEEEGSASALGQDTFSVSGRVGGVAESFTYTIKDSFY